MFSIGLIVQQGRHVNTSKEFSVVNWNRGILKCDMSEIRNYSNASNLFPKILFRSRVFTKRTSKYEEIV